MAFFAHTKVPTNPQLSTITSKMKLVKTGIDGTWINKDSNTRGITKVIISKNGSQIHTYGKCHPRDCDWKTTTLKKYRDVWAVGRISYIGFYDQGFATKTIYILQISGNELALRVSAKYRDKRPDRTNVYYMRKSTNSTNSPNNPSLSDTYTKMPITADVTTRYGTYGCNTCVPDVPAAFGRASGSHKMRKSYKFAPKHGPLNGVAKPEKFAQEVIISNDHIQGITRLSGVGNENYFAMTRNARKGIDGGLYIGKFDGIKSNGGSWASARTQTSNTATKYSYHRFRRLNHAGGLQALGSMIFVAADCNEKQICDAQIKIIDASQPERPKEINALVIDGKQNELSPSQTRTAAGKTIKVSSNAAAVAAIRLQNKHYLVFVRRGSSDGWFYISTTPYIKKDTKWKFLDFWHRDDLKRGTKWYSYENVNFIADCNGSIYMVGMGTSDNVSALYRLTSRYNSYTKKRNFNFEYVDKRGLNTDAPLANIFDPFDWKIVKGVLGWFSGIKIKGYSVDKIHELEGTWGVTLRNAGGVHITPDKGLVSYATSRKPTIQIDEFRYRPKKMIVASISIPIKKDGTNTNTNTVEEDNYTFDFRKMKVLKVGTRWAITDGKIEAITFRTKEDAEKAINMIKQRKGLK